MSQPASTTLEKSPTVRRGRTHALLVGISAASASTCVRWLQGHSCECHFATSYREACELLLQRHFHLVLSEMRLADGSAYPLLSRLEGTHSTLFFRVTVDRGCWWLPALLRGQSCWGAPGLRPREFAQALDDIVKGMKLAAQGRVVPEDAVDTHGIADYPRKGSCKS